MTQMKQVKENIKHLLKKEPQCASSFTLLIIRYWMHFDGVTDLKDALGGTNPDAIIRCFRVYAQEEDSLIDPNVMQQIDDYSSNAKRPRQQIIDL